MHKTIKAVTESMEQLKFNTAIAALIDLNSEMLRWPAVPRASAEAFVLMLAPLAPHLAEELWWRLGHARSLAYERWPAWDEASARGRAGRDPGAGDGPGAQPHHGAGRCGRARRIEAAALADAKVQDPHAGKTIRRVVDGAGQAREHRDGLIEIGIYVKDGVAHRVYDNTSFSNGTGDDDNIKILGTTIPPRRNLPRGLRQRR